MITGGRKVIFFSSLGSHYNTCLKRPSLYCLIHFYKRYNLTTLAVLKSCEFLSDGLMKAPFSIHIWQSNQWLLQCPHSENTISTFFLFVVTPASQRTAGKSLKGRVIRHTYLAWRLTMITKVVPLGWDLSIAQRFGWPLRLPQMWVTRTRNFW